MVSIDNYAYELYPKCGFRVSLDFDGFRFTVGDLLCTSFPALHSRLQLYKRRPARVYRGTMLWLKRNIVWGSYFALIACSRSNRAVP